jgi:hypothetical protein
MGRDYLTGEADVGQILSVGVGRRIGQVGNAGK